jgi:hypothetical protein
VGLGTAIESYLALGAPAPEIVRGNDAISAAAQAEEDELTEIDAFADLDAFAAGDPAIEEGRAGLAESAPPEEREAGAEVAPSDR